MKIIEEALLHAGFSAADLRKIRNNTESYGGTLGEAIQDLANRFRIMMWVFSACLMIFIFIFLSRDALYAMSTGIGLLITMLIVAFVQPPVLSYKSWRYWRFNRS